MLNVTTKRVLVGGAFALILTIVFLPVFTGWLVKKRYEQILELALDTSAIQLTTLRYEQGWLSSVVETFIAFEDPKVVHTLKNTSLDFESIKEPMGLLIRHKIFHGPMIHDPYSGKGVHLGQALVYSSAILAKQQLSGEVKPLLEGQELGRARTTLMMDGSGDSEIESIAFKSNKTEFSDNVSWKGLQAVWHFTGNFLKSEFSLSAPGLEIDSDDFDLRLDDLKINTKRSRDVASVWVGEGIVACRTLVLGDGKKPVFEIKDLKFVADNELHKNELLDSTMELFFAKLKMGEQVFGPGTIEGTLRNMDVLALQEIKTVVHAVKEGKKMKSKHPIAEEVIKYLPEILENKPELEIALIDLVTAHGKMDAALHVSVGGEAHQDRTPVIEAFETLDANLHFTMPKEEMLFLLGENLEDVVALENVNQELTPEAFRTLLRNAAALRLRELEEEGLIVVRGEAVEFRADIKNEKFTINGKRKVWPF